MKIKELIKYLKKNFKQDDMCFSYDTLNGNYNLLSEKELDEDLKKNILHINVKVSSRRIDY